VPQNTVMFKHYYTLMWLAICLTIGRISSRDFTVIAACAWNRLPTELKLLCCIWTSCHKRKTILCQSTYRSLTVHHCRAGSSHSSWVCSDTCNAHSAPEEDHHRVIAVALRWSAVCRTPIWRLKTTWLRTTDDDLQSLNFGVHMAWQKARDRDVWHQVVSTAMLHWGVHQ